ncbi:MAG TPA: DUF4179 domain-containing protein [Candidatus Dormibacteraeota bacterium]|nr:DUF4179 domain-containing protein [Candidatus Dormibacteraeota bacterium]
MTDDLELRLRNLPRSAVLSHADKSAIDRLEPRSRKSHRRVQLTAAGAAVLIAVLLANVVVAYFAPRYERALADSGVGSISQKFLAAVGLNDGDVTAVSDSATSSGHTVKLVAGYADGLRTNFFLTIDGKGLTGNPKDYGRNPTDLGVGGVTLTDQFGRAYQGSGVWGPTEIQFEALLWPASELGSRMTLHVSSLTNYRATTISGDWTLHAALISESAHKIPLPAAVHTSRADYVFTGITASETEMILRWTVSGPAADEARTEMQHPPLNSNPFGTPVMLQYFTPRVYDAAGNQLQMQEWGFTWPRTGPAQGEMTVFVKGPGRYRIQLGAAVESRSVVLP